jgi:hypothetical protein
MYAFIPTEYNCNVCAEEEDRDLSSLRARNILRNNQFAHRLGVRRLAELLQSSVAKKKAVGKSIDNKSKVPILVINSCTNQYL